MCRVIDAYWSNNAESNHKVEFGQTKQLLAKQTRLGSQPIHNGFERGKKRLASTLSSCLTLKSPDESRDFGRDADEEFAVSGHEWRHNLLLLLFRFAC